MNIDIQDKTKQEDKHLTRADVESLLQEVGSADKLDLTNRNLTGIDLSFFNLTGANLSRVNLSRVNLSEANLSEANLNRADLSDADLSNADFSDADLSGADLKQAYLARANLTFTNFTRANLRDADLRGVAFGFTNFEGADLSGADLSGADLSRDDPKTFKPVSEDDIPIATGTAAFLARADLSNANLSNANLSYSDLSNINLIGVDLTGAILIGTSFNGDKIDKNQRKDTSTNKFTSSTDEIESTSFHIRIMEEPLTPHNLTTTLSAITDFTTKCWLIGKGRFADLIEYTQTHDVRFIQETQLTFTKITYNSPFDAKLNIDLSAANVATAIGIAIDGVVQTKHRLEKVELEIKEKMQVIEHTKQKADQESKAALLEQEKQELAIERERLEVLEKRLEVQKKGIEYALEIASRTVNMLQPNADEQTKAIAIQTLLPTLLQMNNGKGLELVLPAPQPQSDEEKK